jgi:hypothetical protein
MFCKIQFLLVEKKKPSHQGIHGDQQIGDERLIIEHKIHIWGLSAIGNGSIHEVNMIYILKHKKHNSHQGYGNGKIANGIHVFFSRSQNITVDDHLWLRKEMPKSFK